MSDIADMPDIHGYRIESVLGQDGNVTLYKAVDLALNQLVAIKVFNPEFFADAGFRDMYFQEVDKIKDVHHQNVAAILDVIHDGDRHCIVMEHLESSLKSRVSSSGGGAGGLVLESNVVGDDEDDFAAAPDGPAGKGLTAGEALDVALQVAQGLKVVHGHGLVHRNINSYNIMFRLDGTPVLTNFAVIPAVGAGFKPTAVQPPLDPHYMSPEQLSNAQVDPRSDIYSLGIVLFEMLTGRLPFESDSNASVAEKHQSASLPELQGDLKKYQLLLEQMVAKETDYRIQNANKLVALLENPAQVSSVQMSQSLDEAHPRFESKQQIEDYTRPRADVPSGSVSPEIPSEERRSFHKTPYKEGKGKSGFFSDFFADPVRIVLVVVGVFLLGLTAYFLLKSSGGAVDVDSTGNTQVQSNQAQDSQPVANPKRKPKGKGKSPAQSAKDNSYNEYLQQAQAYIQEERFDDALAQVNFARAVKNTKQLTELEAKIKESKKQKALKDFAQYMEETKTEFEAGNYAEAKNKLLLAKEIKSTYDLMELEQQIEQKLVEQAEKERIQERLRLAEERKEDDAYHRASLRNTVRSYENYVRRYPKGRYYDEVMKKISGLQSKAPTQSQVKQTGGLVKTTLRKSPQAMSKAQVQAMLKQRNFFDNYDNKTGDFVNGFSGKVINGDAVVIDEATGLMWLQSGSAQHMNYGNALEWMNRLNERGYAGYSDWRLPTLEEGASLLEPKAGGGGLYINPQFSTQQSWIWTSDLFENDGRWLVRFNTGDVYGRSVYDSNYVRLVRSIH